LTYELALGERILDARGSELSELALIGDVTGHGVEAATLRR